MPSQPQWLDDLTQEVLVEFCKGYGKRDLNAAIVERNRLLWKARFRKHLMVALDKKLDREIAEAIKEIV